MLKIRRAQQEDCHSIGSVHSAAVSGIPAALYTPEEIQAWAVPRQPASYEEAIRSKEFFVAEDGGGIVGFGVLNQEIAEVEAVYVTPEAGGRGIGLEILRKLEERATALGLRMLRLNASLNAVPFYEKAGYVAQERSKYRLLTGVEIACVPMVKAMTPAQQVLMNPELRHVTKMPLAELWNESGVVAAQKIRDLGSSEIVAMLRAGRVRFVVADIGHHLQWIPLDDCYQFWKSEVKLHLAQPEAKIYLEDFPGEYCYCASEWKADAGEPIVLLMMSH